MTALIVPSAPSTPPHAAGDPNSFVTVFANLLPDEIVDARRTRRMRRRVLSGLVVLLVLIGCGYAVANWQTRQARADLATAQSHADALRQQQQQFTPLVQAQARASAIQQALQTVMADDMQWSPMLTALRHNAPNGVTLTAISGTLADGTSPQQGGVVVLNQSGALPAGTMTITGTAPSQRAVAAYVDALGKVHGLAVPYPASVSSASGKVTFSLSVIITTDALGGRYTKTTQGGN